MPKISVIVPAYNVQSYVRCCLESILNQSYKNFELIVVNDKSTDQTANIIYEVCKLYPDQHIQYVETSENGGVGNARNVGIYHAQGEYIGFVDGDDWIDSNFYHALLTEIEVSESDIAIAGIRTEYGNSRGSLPRYCYSKRNCISGDFALRLLSRVNANDVYITPMVSNKLYRREFIQKYALSFGNDSYCEDDIFTFCCFLYASKVVLVPEINYHYFQRNSSITHTFSKKHIDDLMQAFSLLKDILYKNNLFDRYQEMYHAFFDKCISSTLSILFSTEQDSVIQKRYITYFFEQFIAHFYLNDTINYLDIQRIKDLFYIR